MTITFSVKDTGTGTADDKVTASITFASGKLYLVSFSSAVSVGQTEQDNQWSVSGAGLTWDRVAEIPQTAAGDRRGSACFRAVGSGSGALTISYGGTETVTSIAYEVLEVSGCITTSNGADGIAGVGENQNTASPASATITGTPVTGDVCFAMVGREDATTPTNDPTWEANYSTSSYVLGIDQWLLTGTSTAQDQSPSASWTQPPNSLGWSIIAFILKAQTASALDDSGIYPGFEAQSNPLVISVW